MGVGNAQLGLFKNSHPLPVVLGICTSLRFSLERRRYLTVLLFSCDHLGQHHDRTQERFGDHGFYKRPTQRFLNYYAYYIKHTSQAQTFKSRQEMLDSSHINVGLYFFLSVFTLQGASDRRPSELLQFGV